MCVWRAGKWIFSTSPIGDVCLALERVLDYLNVHTSNLENSIISQWLIDRLAMSQDSWARVGCPLFDRLLVLRRRPDGRNRHGSVGRVWPPPSSPASLCPAVVIMSALRTTLCRIALWGGIVRLVLPVLWGTGATIMGPMGPGGSYGRPYWNAQSPDDFLFVAKTTGNATAARGIGQQIIGTAQKTMPTTMTTDPSSGTGTDTATSTSPVASMLSDFPNRAIEREVRRHDRYVVDGLAFINTIKGFTVSNATVPMDKPFTVVILTRNRAVPYIAVLLSMLLRGHAPRMFRLMLDIHVINVERRKGKERYHLFDAMERKFSQLMTFHRWTEPYGEIEDSVQNDSDQDRGKWFDDNQRLDYIRALELCQSVVSKWCLVLQDDALPVDNFVGNLQHYIDRQTYVVKGNNGTEEIALENVGMIKLFSAYNCGEADNERALRRKEYAETQYHADIEQTKIRKFAHRFSTTPPCGALAEAFPSTVLTKVASYLEAQEGQVDKLFQNFATTGHNNLTVLELSQTMVNHIGFVSEVNGGDFDEISTDVRFSLTRGVEWTASTGRSSRTFSISGMQGIFDVNNGAITREIQKHDRYVVDSLVYWDQFNEDEEARYRKANDESSTAQITLIVMTVNRYIPYLSVFLGTLIRGHTPRDFANFDLHVVNIERRLGKQNYTLFDDFKEKLGSFVSFHNWTDLYHDSAGVSDSTKHYYADQRQDYIRSLKLCQSNNSTYCLIFEDDALPCVGFLNKFRRYVDLEKYQVDTKTASRSFYADTEESKANATKATRRGQVAVTKLFTSWNDPLHGTSLFQKYGAKDYPRDRALDLFEASVAGQEEVEEVQHRICLSGRNYGIVGDAYHAAIVPKLLDYLEAAGTGTYPVDSLINKKFVEDTGLERLVVDPAMVNHIGYMSEHVNDAQINTKRIFTDVRFQLDDGSYWKKQ